MYDDAPIAKNAARPATSSGVPIRFNGVRLRTSCLYFSSFKTVKASGVSIYQGTTAFTRICLPAHSAARFFVIWFIAALVIPYGAPVRKCPRPATDEMLITDGYSAFSRRG